jgi:peptidoglycan hydrolase CwlO-like protein
MSTLEALNAISEAIEAHKILPDIQRQLKEAREAHDYALLELDDARNEIEKLRAELDSRIGNLDFANNIIRDRNETIVELRERNTALDASLSDVTTLYNDAQHTIVERNLQIDSLRFTADSLQFRLAESKSYGTKLAETLKSIGASIVAAVEVPEVTSESPFPMANPVAMPDSPSDQSNDQSSTEPNGNVAEPTAADLVGVAEDNSSSFNTAPGTNVYKYW